MINFLHITTRRISRPSRRHGVITIYMALGLVGFLGMTGLVVDMGHLYRARAREQQAADAAALAGAYHLQDKDSPEAAAHAAAQDFSARNGYANGVDDIQVTGTIIGGGSQYHVEIRHPEQLYFMRVFGLRTKTIFAQATAIIESKVALDTNGGGRYGVAEGVSNPSLFGPDGQYSFGDAYSTKRLDDGRDNPRYSARGYDYALDIPSSYNISKYGPTVDVELFDPDCHVPGGIDGIDELRGGKATTTVYSLYAPNGTLLAEATYGDDPTTDGQWVVPDQGGRPFAIDVNTYGFGSYRINVKSIDGASENGFKFRAGPPHAAMPDSQWSTEYGDNGTSITASGKMPMNFTTSGTVTITLGEVPQDAAGGTMTIDKFDTDVGAKSVNYTYTKPDGTASGLNFPGELASNGTWKADTISLPADYSGGVWKATYEAGQADTSVWQMSYSNHVPGTPGSIRLIE